MMKPKLVVLIILIFSCHLKGQLVEDFNSGLGIFFPYQSILTHVTSPLNTIDNSPYVVVEDNAGGAGFGVGPFNKSDFLQLYNSNDHEICFDYKVIDDLGTGLIFNPKIGIDLRGNTTTSPILELIYISHTQVDQSSDWVTVCAPLWACSNGIPSTQDGQWWIRGAFGHVPITHISQWNAVSGIMTSPSASINIEIVLLGNEFNGAGGSPVLTGEKIGYDNILFQLDSNIYANTIEIDGPADILYTCNYPINLNTTLTSTAPAGSLFSYLWFVDGQEIIGVNNPTFVLEPQDSDMVTVRVEVTDPNGCIEFDELEIKPTGFSINVDDVITCSFPIDIGHTGVSWNLPSGSGVPQGISSYLWSTGETTQQITVNQAGTYTVTITDLMGCTDSKDIVVTGNTTTVDAGLDIEECGPGPVNLSGTTSASQIINQRWLLNGVEVSNSQTYQATESGTYTYEVTDDNDCVTSDDVEVIIRDLRLIPGLSINTCNQNGTFTATVSSEEEDPIYVRIFVHSDPDRISIPNSESTIVGPCPIGNPCPTSYTFNAPHPYETYVMEIKQGNCSVWRVFEVEINELSLTMDDIITCDFPDFVINPMSGVSYSGNPSNLGYQWDLPDGTSSNQMPLVVNQDKNTVESYTLTVGTTGTNCSVSEEFDLTHYCDDPCITFEDKQALYQKKLENSTSNNRIFSTKIYNDEVFSLHLDVSGIGSCGEMTLISVTDLSGDVLRSKRYNSFNGTCVYPKEMHVLEEGIFVLGNKGSWDNTSYSWKMGAVLIKIDPISLDVIWTKEYYMNAADDQKIYAFDEGIFLNAFSPKYDEGQLSGFIIVGNTRRKTNSSLRMNAFFMTIDAIGNTINRKELLMNLPCYSCNGGYESNFAVDISDQVIHSDYEFAVLLESRSNFTGNLGANQGIKMSYVFLDWDLNINKLANSDPYWFRSSNEEAEANPRKISYESRENGGHLVVKIAGQYMDYKKGFISQYDNFFNSGSNSYSLYNVSQYSTDIAALNEAESFDGAVDFIEKDDITYILGNSKIVAIDMSGSSTSLLNQSPRINFPTYTISDFGWTGGYIGGLLHDHPNSGFLVNGIRIPNYVKTGDNLEVTCTSEDRIAELSPISIDEGVAIPFKEKEMLEEDHIRLITEAPIQLESECCSNNETIKDPCSIAVDVDYEVDCEGNVTINSLSVPTSGTELLVEYYNQSTNVIENINYPGSFQMDHGAWNMKITMVLKNGCEKIWESEVIIVPPSPDAEVLNYTTCLDCLTFEPETEIEFVSFYSFNGTNYYGGEEQCLGIGEHTFEYFSENDCLIKTQTINVTQGSASTYDISNILPCISLDGAMAGYISFDASYLWGFCQPNNGLINGWHIGPMSSTSYPDASTHLITSPGDFSFTTTLDNGCPCTVSGTILPCPMLKQKIDSSNETRSDSELIDPIKYIIAPNPTSGIFQILNSYSFDKYDNVNILSMTGQLVSEYQNVDASKEYDLSSNSDGVYLIRVTTGRQTKLLKLVLTH